MCAGVLEPADPVHGGAIPGAGHQELHRAPHPDAVRARPRAPPQALRTLPSPGPLAYPCSVIVIVIVVIIRITFVLFEVYYYYYSYSR